MNNPTTARVLRRATDLFRRPLAWLRARRVAREAARQALEAERQGQMDEMAARVRQTMAEMPMRFQWGEREELKQ